MSNLDEVNSVIKDLLAGVTPADDKLELPVGTPSSEEINALAKKALWAALKSGRTDTATSAYIQCCNTVVSWSSNE